MNDNPGAKGLTIEFLVKPTPGCFMRGGGTTLFQTTKATVAFEIGYSGISFTAKTSDTTDPGLLSFGFSGDGVLSADYLWNYLNTSDEWHHFALVKDAVTGAQKVFIDGESQPSMRREIIGRQNPDATMGTGDTDLFIDFRDRVSLCAG